jgi:DNA-binding MarR family transcriptional regulator
MGISDSAVEIRARGWRTLVALHGLIETRLSSSATTRLVSRLEDRGLLTRILCDDDRRGIYTELTQDGDALLARARPTHDATLESALAEAEAVPELGGLVAALHQAEPATV